MRKLINKTPLIAAFFLLTCLSACGQESGSRQTETETCTSSTTAVAQIQGAAPTSGMVGQQVAVQGIVTLLEAGHGIYIEEPDSDNDKRISNALYLEENEWDSRIKPGTQIFARGTVTEITKGRNSLTALNNIETMTLCGSHHSLPLSDADLPLTGLEREALEGMRIKLPATLTVTDNYRLKSGQINVSGNGFQYVATEVVQPGVKAGEYASENQTYLMPLQIQPPASADDVLVAGTDITNLTGVMTHDDRALRLTVASMSTSPAQPQRLNQQSTPKPVAAGELRVVSMNLHNYFNGDGDGGGFPTDRGAKTLSEFNDQRRRIGAALNVLKPHLIAVMELENDGFAANSAAADFIGLLNQAVGGDWQAARPEHDNTGNDAITVGLFFRADTWQPAGSARTLSGPEFERSRQPLAQVFQPLSGGDPLLLVVNHLKSKGSCPDSGPDADQKDGQGCWSPIRTTSAQKMSAWVKSLATTDQLDNMMIMGDMNAYRNEDPVNAIRAAGFEELMDGQSSPTFSFMYFGQAGTLDYAFVSPALRQKTRNSFIWHINSTMPANMELPQPWMRFSDHDPVVVDLLLRH